MAPGETELSIFLSYKVVCKLCGKKFPEMVIASVTVTMVTKALRVGSNHGDQINDSLECCIWWVEDFNLFN